MGFIVKIMLAGVLTTPTMNVEFGSAGEGFGLKRIVNRVAGDVEFGGEESALWALKFNSVVISNTVKAEKSYSIKDGKAAFAWRNIDLSDEVGVCDVFVEVKAAGELANWSISVRNRSKKVALESVTFPIFNGIVKDGEADVLVPWKNMGARLMKKYDSTKEKHFFSYSPSCRPPMFAFMKGEAGLYVAAHDSAWRIKEAHLRTGANLTFTTEVENSGIVGKASGDPRVSVVMGGYRGDWWQAARIYREWALRQKWAAKRLCERDDFVRKAAEVDVWTMTHGSCETYSNAVTAMHRAWPDFLISAKWQRLCGVGGPKLQNCEGTPEWGYCSKQEADTVKYAKDLGMLVMPYTNGRIWHERNSSWAMAERFACLTAKGERQCEKYTGGKYGVMCPTCLPWQDTVKSVSTRFIDESPFVNAIYIDQVACSPYYPCRDASHGHPIGGGRWWNDANNAMFEKVHRETSRRGVLITSEQFGDFALDKFDAFLNATEHTAEDVPFFPAVYSGYAIYYGTEAHWLDSPDAFFAIEARFMKDGIAPGWIPSYYATNPKLKHCCETIAKIAKVRKVHRDYFAYGTLMDELRPLNELPKVEYVHYYTEHARGKAAYTNAYPVVIGSRWKNCAGDKQAILAINVGRQREDVRFKAPNDEIVTLTLDPKEITFREW